MMVGLKDGERRKNQGQREEDNGASSWFDVQARVRISKIWWKDEEEEKEEEEEEKEEKEEEGKNQTGIWESLYRASGHAWCTMAFAT